MTPPLTPSPATPRGDGTAPYGSWPSPIGAALAASLDGRPEYVGAIGAEVWWTVPRPAEGGRRALVRRPADGGPAVCALPAPWNVRSRVTEYGGLPWAGAERPWAGRWWSSYTSPTSGCTRTSPTRPAAPRRGR